jgi:hypothetical protein
MKKGLLVGSGAMESANKDVIQKKLKLSGQRWSVNGANQIANLRTCYKSGKHDFIIFLIKNFKKLDEKGILSYTLLCLIIWCLQKASLSQNVY